MKINQSNSKEVKEIASINNTENHFCGFIKNFVFLKQGSETNVIKEFLQNPFEWLSKNPALPKLSLINLSSIAGINKFLDSDDLEWSSIDLSSAFNLILTSETNKTPKKGYNINALFFDNLIQPEKKLFVVGKGLTYSEKSRFEDVFFSTGNIDVLFRGLELIWESKDNNDILFK